MSKKNRGRFIVGIFMILFLSSVLYTLFEDKTPLNTGVLADFSLLLGLLIIMAWHDIRKHIDDRDIFNKEVDEHNAKVDEHNKMIDNNSMPD